ncbi:MAG: hypothetical protein ACE5IK_02590 [Acidobacteriota bacterium]
MMTIREALTAGLQTVVCERRLVVALWLINLLIAWPAASVVSAALGDAIGSSQVSESLTQGFDMGWFGEFQHEARGLATTFSPTLEGGGAFLDNLEAWVSGTLFGRYPVVIGAAAGYMAVWLLLIGGVIDRFAVDRGDRSVATFIGAGGRTLIRFFRLALLSAVVYVAIFAAQRAVFSRLGDWTRESTRETPVLIMSLAIYATTAAALLLAHLCFAYAKIATVVEERRSMVLAAIRGLAFVLLHPRQTLGMAGGVLLAAGVGLVLYTWLAPGAGQASAITVGAAFLFGQLFLLTRLVLRLTHLAGQTALYRRLSGA